MANELSYRQATADDSELLADFVIGVPDQEITRVAMLLYGIRRFEDARALFRIAWRAGGNWRWSTIAEMDGEPVGLLQIGHSAMPITARQVLSAVRRLSPLTLLRMPARLRIRARVMPRVPHDAYVVAELHVAPERRGRGLGFSMLQHAEDNARRLGHTRMALVTLTTNPARKLYERCGFEIASVRTDPEHARITGADGNLLMVKPVT